ncbi:MAG: B12-binding domain-containing radical SAM protein [Proteobacteria bacterium]|nr:B12-binding domain-containing radical SAM protein [Pseudomonadota bacterium]MBU1584019.1 B12-binding domain-containing radical SAM protein [Pseudomonadota bacterium]MBU2456141.1 B12-binding domain-containing radical SAM protein [Pseudomonadota bacterium]MBU2630897.1 B12-binding domain-containing radical SAM protein [Pseudomonadota bacterium]
MKPLKVILVQPPIQDFYLTKKRTIPYGLAAIAACIKQKGFDVDILDALSTDKSKTIDYPEAFSYLEPFYGKKDISFFSLFHEFKHFGYSYEHIGTKIRAEKPFVVGISSLFTAYCSEAIKTAQTVKKFHPECKIVLGGHHPTIFPEKVLECRAVDYVLRGEGETCMAQLCEALRDGSALEQIPGIAFKKKTAVHISPPSWIPDFDGLPLPCFELINHNFYQRKNRGSISVVSSRGCPMQCSYCSVSATSSHAPFRQRKVEDVIKEIKMQTRNHDIGFIDFEDENLCLDKQWFVRLFSQINPLVEGKNIELRAMNGLFPPAVDEEIVSLMKTAGFKALNLSLGSTSKAQLKKFKRRDVRASFETALVLAQKYGLECVSYIIAAAPGQTAASSLEDLLYLAQKRTLIGLSIYYPAPGSLDYQVCQDNKILPKSFALMRSTALPFNDTTSRLQAVTLLRLSRIINFMKHLVDTTGSIPEPKAFSQEKIPLSSDRLSLSKELLQWFLEDGKIRGVSSIGEIYTHYTDKTLTLECIERIKTIEITGVK